MRVSAFAAAAAVAFGITCAPAYAADYSFSFDGTTSQGAFTATGTLDVEGGYAVSGSGTISGAQIGTDQAFTLVTAQTPGAFNSGGGTFGYENKEGDEPFGLDDAIPLNGNGILFATGAKDVNGVGDLLFGADNVNGAFFLGYSSTGFRFDEQLDKDTFDATEVSAAPEPASWALMMLGVGFIGWALGYRKRVVVDHRAKLAAIG